MTSGKWTTSPLAYNNGGLIGQNLDADRPGNRSIAQAEIASGHSIELLDSWIPPKIASGCIC
jgi:hypothetical protein